MPSLSYIRTSRNSVLSSNPGGESTPDDSDPNEFFSTNAARICSFTRSRQVVRVRLVQENARRQERFR